MIAPAIKGARESNLSRGRRAWGGLRKIRAQGRYCVLRQRQGSDRLQQGHGRHDNYLRRGLVTQVAVRATRVVIRALVIPIADDTRGEDQEYDERQRNPEYSNRLLHRVFGQFELDERPDEY
jgi:hypothetical protein